MIDQGKKLIP